MSGATDPQGRCGNRRPKAALTVVGHQPSNETLAREAAGFRPWSHRRGAWTNANLPNPLRRMGDFARRPEGAP